MVYRVCQPGLSPDVDAECSMVPDPDNPLLRIKDCEEKLRLLKAGKLGTSWRERQQAAYGELVKVGETGM